MSILDYKQPHLCEDIWDINTATLTPEVRFFVLKSVRTFFEDMGISEATPYVSDVLIGSSLATLYYKDDTDFDVKVVIESDRMLRFIKSSEITPYNLADYLTKIGRKSLVLTSNVPGTQHALDVYFYSFDDFFPINYNKYDSLYSLKLNSWLEEPQTRGDFVDPDAILNIALKKAEPYIDVLVSDITKAKRDVIDLIMFRDYISSLDTDDRERVFEFFQQKFNEANNSINELISDKKELKALRTQAFSKDNLESELEKVMQSFNYSDENLIFKIIQRYGYMRILAEVQDKMEESGFNADNINDYANILTI